MFLNLLVLMKTERIVDMDRIDESKELKDVYDVNRMPIGKVVTRDTKLPIGEYYMVVHICIINDKNELLVQHRQPFKNGWSNLWDISAAGGVLAGETSQMAAHREVLEEIGLDIDFSEIRPTFTFNFENGFDDYYFIRENIDNISDLKLQKEEVSEIKWVGHDKLMSMVDEGIMVRYFFLDYIFNICNLKNAFDYDADRIDIRWATFKNIISINNTFEVCCNFDNICDYQREYVSRIKEYIAEKRVLCALNEKKVVAMMDIDKDSNKYKMIMIHPRFIEKDLERKMVEFTKKI